MSTFAVVWAIHQKGINASAFRVLTTLAEHHNNKTGLICPSIPLLAVECEMSERTVHNAMRQLEERGLVKIIHQYRKDQGQRSSKYELNMPPLQILQTPPADTADVTMELEPVSVDKSTGAPAPTGSAIADKPQNNNVWSMFHSMGGNRGMVTRMIKKYGEKAVVAAIAEMTLREGGWNDPNAVLQGKLKKNPDTGAAPDWAKIPENPDHRMAWATKHGHPMPGHMMDHNGYFNLLKESIDNRYAKQRKAA